MPTLLSEYLPTHRGVRCADIEHYRDRLIQYGREVKSPAWLEIKNHFIAVVGEYVGTFLFMIFALGGTNVANMASMDQAGLVLHDTSNLLYIALCFGFSLTVNVWIFFRVSGGIFNPAVSLGMALVGVLTPTRAVLLVGAQVLGGLSGAAVVDSLVPGGAAACVALAPDVSAARGLFIEMFLTALLMLAILFLAAEKHKATFLAPIGIGLALFVAELFGVPYTGGALNPARALGPAVVVTRCGFERAHWVYWLGPALGAALAAAFYIFVKFLEYETVLGPEDYEHKLAQAHEAAASKLGLGLGLGLGGDGAPGLGLAPTPLGLAAPLVTLLDASAGTLATAPTSRLGTPAAGATTSSAEKLLAPASAGASEDGTSISEGAGDSEPGMLERLHLPHLHELLPSPALAPAAPGLPLPAAGADGERLARIEALLTRLLAGAGGAERVAIVDEEKGLEADV